MFCFFTDTIWIVGPLGQTIRMFALLTCKYLTLPKGTWPTLGYAPFQNMMVAYYSGPKVNKCSITNLLGK